MEMCISDDVDLERNIESKVEMEDRPCRNILWTALFFSGVFVQVLFSIISMTYRGGLEDEQSAMRRCEGMLPIETGIEFKILYMHRYIHMYTHVGTQA